MEVTVFDSHNTALGEGPRWSNELDALCWVDIIDNLVFVRGKKATQSQSYSGFDSPSSVILSKGDDLTVVDAQAIWSLDLNTGKKSLVTSIPQGNSGNRSNESQIDPLGNTWVGRMNRNEEIRSGELLCISQTSEITVAVSDMGIPNTLVWDELRQRMYFGDSSDKAIYVVDVISGNADFSTKSIFSQLPDEFGEPDGSAIDSRGHIFNARWGAGCVLEFNPEGNIVRTIPIPTPNVTSCALNCNESTLYVTTASIGLTSTDAYSGATFAVQL